MYLQILVTAPHWICSVEIGVDNRIYLALIACNVSDSSHNENQKWPQQLNVPHVCVEKIYIIHIETPHYTTT